MFIVPISSLNFKSKNTENLQPKKNQNTNCTNFSNQIYPQSNVLQAQMLFRLKTNDISFKGLTLKPNLFKDVAAVESNPLWEKLIVREVELYKKPNEIRSEFSRDCDRILHSNAYNAMMGKTQVFIQPKSDSTCTRIGHVNQVASIAENLAEFFGLNPKLTRAIGIGHDLGHTPFGHEGEMAIDAIVQKQGLNIDYWQGRFWHEKNGLRSVDEVETKLDMSGSEKNLNLTYAVRDGIISHCGEVDENGLKPRTEYLDLKTIQRKYRPQPYTWEGCVVKVSDKIAYLGKDLEDAINNKFLSQAKKAELVRLIKQNTGMEFEDINNTVLINHFISDLCANSNPQDGLKFSEPTFKLMNTIKKFNYESIYFPKGKNQTPYCNLVINTIFEDLNASYKGKKTLSELKKKKEQQPLLVSGFSKWLIKYSDITSPEKRKEMKLANKVIYSINNPDDYKLAIIDYMSSLTDKTAATLYEEIAFFG